MGASSHRLDLYGTSFTSCSTKCAGLRPGQRDEWRGALPPRGRGRRRKAGAPVSVVVGEADAVGAGGGWVAFLEVVEVEPGRALGDIPIDLIYKKNSV